MRFMARMLAVCVVIGLTIVAAYAASFTLINKCNEAFTVVINYTDSSSEPVFLPAYSSEQIGIGTKTVSSVTINGYTVNSGVSGYPIILPSGAGVYVTVSSVNVTVASVPVD